MQTQLNDNILTLRPEGRIDSANAAQVEQEIQDAIKTAPGAELELDADGLDYISSAGLRVLMKLRKQTGKPLTVWNVSPEVYDIFEVTGFTELLDVRRRMREVSVHGCELLGEGANGKVYRLTRDEMIKVFRPGLSLEEIEAEREASRRTFLLGVPCAIAFDTVMADGSYGTIYETLNAATITERIRETPERLPELAAAAAQLLRQLHETEVPAGELPDAMRLLYGTLDKVAEDFTPEEAARLRALYASIPPMNRFVHNDYHTKNVMEADGELMLIDLGDAGAGNPVIDLIHCYFVFNLIGDSTPHSEEDIAFIGLTYGEMKRFWTVFIETYCGDKVKAEALCEKLEPYARLMYYTVSMAHPRLPKAYHPAYAEKVRKLVLSRYDEILGSLADPE